MRPHNVGQLLLCALRRGGCRVDDCATVCRSGGDWRCLSCIQSRGYGGDVVVCEVLAPVHVHAGVVCVRMRLRVGMSERVADRRRRGSQAVLEMSRSRRRRRECSRCIRPIVRRQRVLVLLHDLRTAAQQLGATECRVELALCVTRVNGRRAGWRKKRSGLRGHRGG